MKMTAGEDIRKGEVLTLDSRVPDTLRRARSEVPDMLCGLAIRDIAKGEVAGYDYRNGHFGVELPRQETWRDQPPLL